MVGAAEASIKDFGQLSKLGTMVSLQLFLNHPHEQERFRHTRSLFVPTLGASGAPDPVILPLSLAC